MRSPKKRIRHRDRNYMIYVLAFLIALTGVLGILKGNPVLVAEEESTQKGSISIVCPVEGMELSLYRVAEYEESGSFTLTEQFQKYPVSLEQKSQEGWQGAADALADYIRRDGITADAVLASGSDRTVCFTDLNRGLYLVLGQTTELQEDGKTQIYEPQTALIALPEDSQGTSEGMDPYQVTAVLKFEKNDKPGNPEETKIHVLKVWKQDQEKERPDSIVVELLQTDVEGNTTVVDRQTLTKENKNLSTLMRWSVSEAEVPNGYTVAVTREGDTVVLTNTAKESGNPDGEVNPPSKKPTDKTVNKTTDKTSDKLPQTGQLWWPVLVLLFAGAICLLVGRVLRDRKEEKNR
ncbi:Cna B-type domain-containing protein [Lachnospiraceae bacterium SGI.256]